MENLEPQGSEELQNEVIDLDALESDNEEQWDMTGAQVVEGTESRPYEAPEQEEITPEQSEPSWEMPEKYKGKEIRDIIEMHQNAERALGQANNKVNELRKVSESIVSRELDEPKQAQTQSTPDISVDSLLEQPAEVINQLIASNPTLKTVVANLEKTNRDAQMKEFNKQYPDAEKIVASEHFQNWIQGSQFRLNAFLQANDNYDFATAGELLDMYNQIHGVAKAQAEQKREEDLKKVSSTAPGKAPASNKGKKLYKMSQVMKIMVEDPEKYERLCQGDLGKAWEEGRIIED